MSLPSFTWLSQSQNPPARWDLRLLDWSIQRGFDTDAVDGSRPCLLDWRAGMRPDDWQRIRRPEAVAVVGADEPETRAALLDAGFGDALGSQVALVELAARLLKLRAFTRVMPRQRQAGPATLDLFYRDARIGESWIGLHPREFGLLWRLAETPLAPVSRRELLADVWRLEHVPETNSLEVHVSRLRAKLAISRCAWLIETHPGGGYRLGSDRHDRFQARAVRRREALDRPVAIGNCPPQSPRTEERHHAGQRSRFD